MTQHAAILSGRQAIATIGIRAGQRQAALQLHVVRHLWMFFCWRATRLPGGGEFDGRYPGTEEVGTERDDDVGLVELVMRQHTRAVSFLVRF